MDFLGVCGGIHRVLLAGSEVFKVKGETHIIRIWVWVWMHWVGARSSEHFNLTGATSNTRPA